MAKVLRAICISLFGASAASAEPAGDWAGYYAGGGLSYSKAETTVLGNRWTYNQNRAVNLVEHGYDGGAVSGFVGWNAQRDRWVYGAEFLLSLDSLDSNLVFNSDNDIDQVEIKWSGALAGRVGHVLGDTLVYAKGGLAFARFSNIGGDVNSGALTLSDAHMRDDVLYGPMLALGVERFVAKNWSARVEYSYTDFGDYSQANQDGVPGSQVYQVSNGPVQRLTLGFAYHF